MQRVFLFAVLFTYSALAFVQSPLSSIRQRLVSIDVHSPRKLFTFERQRVSTLRSISPMMATYAPTTVSVGIVGTGGVGGELFRQLEKNKVHMLKTKNIDVKVVAVSCLKDGKSWMLLEYKGITFADYEAALKKGKGEVSDFKAFGSHVVVQSRNAVIFDCTASESVANQYEGWLRAGACLVTSNNLVGSGPLDRYKRVKAAAAEKGLDWGYEATVGAGLPIIHVLRNDLLDTGDRVSRIVGTFSKSQSYIFNAFRPGVTFSSVIADAKAKGITAPDPREDLSGMDVARKLVILARECGLDLELSQVPVRNLVPPKLQSWQPAPGENAGDAFVEQLKAFDDEAATVWSALTKNEVLRYVGVVDFEEKKACVDVRKFPRSHRIAKTEGTENICAIVTDRCHFQPAVIQGPASGAALTAAGLLANFLRIARRFNI